MIFITGATGLLGSRVAYDALLSGKKVRALKRKSSDLSKAESYFRFANPERGAALFDQIEWVNGDIKDILSLMICLDGIDQIIHCAALVSYQARDFEKLIEVNQDGTSNLVDAAIEKGVNRFCHISSVAALGNPVSGNVIDETCYGKREELRSGYGLSKYLAEQEVWRGEAEGLRVVVVNPSVILGPSQPGESSGQLMDMLRKGTPYYPDGGSGFVDVADVSRACLALIENQIEGERFILNGENLLFRDLLNQSAEVFHHKEPSFRASPFLLGMAWRILWVWSLISRKSPRITKESARSSSRINKYSSDKIQEKIGLHFTPIKEALTTYRGYFE